MGKKGFLASLVLHAALAVALTVLPLFSEEALPGRAEAEVVGPVLSLPAPPPPALVDVRVTRRAGPLRSDANLALAPPAVSPATVGEPDTSLLDDGLRPESVGDGDGTGSDTIGSVMGDLPTSAPAPPARVVRINAGLLAPRLVHRVQPAYPALAVAARVTAVVVLEAEVDAHGQVARVAVLHGHPLFDAAAVEAVRQWRYQPLLLSGEPTAFILTVTIRFELPR